VSRSRPTTQAEQVIQTAAINADHGDLATREQLIQRQARLSSSLPEIGAGPAVGPEVHADLDVQMLGEELLE
jgi:hypothetical protein